LTTTTQCLALAILAAASSPSPHSDGLIVPEGGLLEPGQPLELYNERVLRTGALPTSGSKDVPRAAGSTCGSAAGETSGEERGRAVFASTPSNTVGEDEE
jgi:hypothetical protein